MACLALVVVGVVGTLVTTMVGTGIVPRVSDSARDAGAVGAGAGLDMEGQVVMLEPGVEPIPATVSNAVADAGSRLVIPSVDLDVPLGALDEVDGVVTPPGFTSAYWIRNLGVGIERAHEGTVYVVMHALAGAGRAPGNYLTDVQAARATLTNGAQVDVGAVTYTVTGWRAEAKNDLPGDSEVWADVPGRLVLITCLQRAEGGPSVDNIVIFASATKAN